jgi:hypothetical protein
VFLLLISPSFTAYITFPLYISSSNWQTLYNSIASNPRLTFNLIINPSSGPGSSTYPSSSYITGLAKLNGYPNLNMLGYVHISYCTRSLSDVQSDVNKYAGWANYQRKDIHMDGIFFDEAPQAYSTADYAYMSSVTSYVRSAFPAGRNRVTFNPGVLPESRYFDLADTINVFEDYYSSYSANTLSAIPAAERLKSTMIMHDFTGTQKQQAALVTSIAGSGISGLYITTSSGYSAFSRLWSQFVSSMAGTV